MSKFMSGLLGAGALLLTVGAAQFAVGQNLPQNKPLVAASAAAAQSSMVNRAGKGDQPANVARDNKVFMTQVNASKDKTVAVRVARESDRRGASLGKSSKRPVACEASASVLTDIAKVMESARCVT